MNTYTFKTSLAGWRGVTRTVVVRGDQTLVDLHRVLQEAYGWEDDHLYSFWLNGRFWGGRSSEYTTPGWCEDGRRSARAKLDGLGLALTQKVAYVFDFGDEWRVSLTLTKVEPAGAGPYPSIVASRGEAPPQYPDYDDEEAFDEVA
jgi:hypothetical protein